jgi:hypothetical protein
MREKIKELGEMVIDSSINTYLGIQKTKDYALNVPRSLKEKSHFYAEKFRHSQIGELIRQYPKTALTTAIALDIVCRPAIYGPYYDFLKGEAGMKDAILWTSGQAAAMISNACFIGLGIDYWPEIENWYLTKGVNYKNSIIKMFA